ncbi:uncharacterized protein SAPINGB_P004003 [Magnusiomyces paraingens]|uniref:CID domain-containing protein n=1 Tax=Magnusiomyces paraingens TaxID=2606893 RepID=A0A5E8BSA5_9ASCO|nr:uncharacterized protein SAPINGB_P004003 [Saprochaete ingens]VVT54293.1 unnamed protein product [Saprochaete ingens]
MSETSAPAADPFTEFTNILDALLSVKPPGVSGSKIRSLTSLAVSNVKLEKSMTDAMYNHLIKTPYSHKLGILYVVDAIARGYQDLAVNESYPTPSEAPEGTYTAAVYRISQLVEEMFVNIFGIPPAEDVKDKMKKVIDIWERCETFPQETLDTIKRKWFNDESTTPPSSPPSHIVEAVRNLTEQHKAQTQDEEANQEPLSPSLRAQETSAPEVSSEVSSEAPSVASAPVPDANFIAQFLEKIKQDPKPTTKDDDTSSSSDNTLVTKTEGGESSSSTLTGDISSNASSTVAAALQSDLITQLLKQNQQGPGGAASGVSATSATSASSTNADQPWNGQTGQNENQEEDSESDDKRGFDRRRRSRSPDGRGNSKRARNNSPKRGKQLDVAPDHEISRERNVTRDPTIPDGSIKVLSRTLFIGGVTSDTTEESLIQIFKPFAEVQSMVFQKEMRHAFVKLYSRAEAEVSRERLEEENKTGRLGLRARWGVGFGPRECCDYQTGISIIPLSKLTEADRRWIVEAEFGGTGGAPLDSGLCIEEPDIEIGAGVSSKAISQRMPSNSSRNGPKSSRGERPEPTFNGAPSGGSSNGGGSGGGNGGGHGRRREGGRHDRRSGRDRDRDRDRGRNAGNGGRNGGGGRYGNGDRNGGGGGAGFRDQRGGGRQGNNGGGNFNGGMPNFGGPVGMQNMGMPGMNMPGAGGFNLPANLATLISSLNQQGMAPGGAPMQQPQQNNHNQRYDRGRGGNRHGNNNGGNNVNNNNGGNNNNNNNPQQLLAQLTQQLSAAAAVQQFGMGGGAPMGGPPQYGGAPPQSYGAPGVSPNLSAALFQLQQAGNQGGRNGGGAPPPPGLGGAPMGGQMNAPMGNGGQLPFNMTQQMATALLQQHQQQQQQHQHQHQHHHHQNQRRN